MPEASTDSPEVLRSADPGQGAEHGDLQNGKPSRDPLGDRMRGYEIEARTRLPRRSLTVIRLDGRAFHSWTRAVGLDRPYDVGMLLLMGHTTKALAEEISGTVLAYTQSDEISLLLQDFAGENTEPWFGGQVQKIISIAASVATAAFNAAIPGQLPAHFDARVFTVPSRVEAANYMLWRQRDARRNAISMLAEHHFSAKQLHGVPTFERRRMLEAMGVDLDAVDERFLNGQVVERATCREPVTYRRKDTGELVTTDPVERSRFEVMPAPEFAARPGNWLYERIPEPPETG